MNNEIHTELTCSLRESVRGKLGLTTVPVVSRGSVQKREHKYNRQSAPLDLKTRSVNHDYNS